MGEKNRKTNESVTQDQNEALRKSEERFHRMVSEVEDYAILLLDEKGFIQNWNAGAEKIKGYKASEIIGKHISVFYLPEDRLSFLPEQLIREATIKGKAVHEGWRVRKDGTTFWGSIVISAIHDEAGKVIGFTKVTRDLSENKRKENQIKQYSEELEQRNRELEQFAYAASHDMKEPLRKIQYYVDAVLDNTNEIIDKKDSEYLERAAHAAKRMQHLIENILNYTRVSSLGEVIEWVDLNDLLKEFVELHQEEIGQYEIDIQYARLPIIKGIEFQLRQLVDNLIGNAIKYRHPDRQSKIQIVANKIKGYEIPFQGAVPDLIYNVVSVIDL
ncbi:MAG: PAS domain S-box protein, partial [Chitinophagaceae bacterium]|nr:PAS domain S-box protein [Chitinophagaceae bacterium]